MASEEYVGKSLEDIIKSKKEQFLKKKKVQKKKIQQKKKKLEEEKKKKRKQRERGRSPRRRRRSRSPRNFRSFQSSDQRGALTKTISNKIIVLNLGSHITKKELNYVFQDSGRIKKAEVFYDATGKSLGKGEITFYEQSDAEKAVDYFNGAELDGKEMRVQLTGGTQVTKVRPVSRGFRNGGRDYDRRDFRRSREERQRRERRERKERQEREKKAAAKRKSKKKNEKKKGKREKRVEKTEEQLNAELLALKAKRTEATTTE